MTSLRELDSRIAPIDHQAATQAAARQTQLIKPPGSLGELERIAVRLASLQGTLLPRVDRVNVCVFAADHGIAAEQVSAFPQAVTAQMLRCFSQGGSAISVLAEAIGASLDVVDLGTVGPLDPIKNVRHLRIGPGTANFLHGAAMTPPQLREALAAGQDSVRRACESDTQLFVAGEMGIANTTAATALACALLNAPAQDLVGPGTGLDAAGLARKVDVIQRALARCHVHRDDPQELLRQLGGFEIAALVGAYLECAARGVPALVDGFICSAAALAAARLQPGCQEWLLFSHISAEPGHRLVLAAMSATPLLDLGMRLGEASGAAVAVPLLRLACTLHAKMATFSEAQVSSAPG